MGITFSHPQYLLLLPFAWLFTWWIARGSLAELDPARKNLSLFWRLALLTVIVLALSGLQLSLLTRTLCTVFVVDVSDSIDPAERTRILHYIRDATKQMRQDDRAALVAFGAEALLDQAPDTSRRMTEIVSLPGSSRTNIAAGLQLALASFPQDAARHIVLLSDGNENVGNSLEQAALAQGQQVRISVVPLQRDIRGGEMLLLGMSAPASVHAGAPFRLSTVVESLQPAQATLTLLRDGATLETRKLTLSKGKTLTTFEQTAPAEGLHHYRALLIPAEHSDSVPDNNVADAYLRVQGKPAVLVVENTPGDGAALARALQAHDIQATLGTPQHLPRNLAECAQYDTLLLANVPSWTMTPAQMAIVRSAVHNTGMGLAMIGGEDSFGAGGYLNTPIEEALPVSMLPRKQKRLPSLTLLIVIDISGSMATEENGVPKIRLAAEAAAAAVQLLQPFDKISVIGFDTRPVAIVPLTEARDKQAITRQILRMQPGGGGILAFPALEEAQRIISDSDTQVKHVILCADTADTETQEGCIELARRMRRDKITLSVIGFGNATDPHYPFHQQLAAEGGGEAYLAERLSNLPQIFTRDVLAAQQSLFVEEPFTPRVVSLSPPDLRNIGWESTPALLGYVQTSMKSTPGARELLASHKDDPIFASWSYGLGRSIAYTSDATRHWGAQWLNWSEFATFWAQSIRWTLRQSGTAQFRTQLSEENGQGRIVVEALTAEGEYRNYLDLRAHLAHIAVGGLEGLQSRQDLLALQQVAPGRYEAYFPLRDIGAYQVTVEERDGETIAGLQSASLVIAYSPEYRKLTTNLPLLTDIARRAHGMMNPLASDIFTKLRFPARTLHHLWPLLLLLLGGLFLCDVALRRVLLPWQQSVATARLALMRTVAGRITARHAPTPRAPAPVLDALLQTKARTRASDKESDNEQSAESLAARLRSAPPTRQPADSPSARPDNASSSPSTTDHLLQRKRLRGGKGTPDDA